VCQIGLYHQLHRRHVFQIHFIILNLAGRASRTKIPLLKVVTAWMASEAYRRLRSAPASEELPESEEGALPLKDTGRTFQ